MLVDQAQWPGVLAAELAKQAAVKAERAAMAELAKVATTVPAGGGAAGGIGTITDQDLLTKCKTKCRSMFDKMDINKNG